MPNLASRALALAVNALPAAWEQAHGYRPLLAETFTDIEAFEGTCYKAAAWQPCGITKGFTRRAESLRDVLRGVQQTRQPRANPLGIRDPAAQGPPRLPRQQRPAAEVEASRNAAHRCPHRLQLLSRMGQPFAPKPSPSPKAGGRASTPSRSNQPPRPPPPSPGCATAPRKPPKNHRKNQRQPYQKSRQNRLIRPPPDPPARPRAEAVFFGP